MAGGVVALSGGQGDHPLRRLPHVLLTAEEIEAAVEDLLHEDYVVIDIETTFGRPRTNELRWVGLGAAGRTYLIPCGHPKGIQTRREHKVKTPACLAFPHDDERGLTKLGKPSMRMVDVTLLAEFAPPPKQLFPHEVCQLIQPLLFSDIAKVGHNVKFDLMSLAKYFGNVIPPGPYHDTIILRHCIHEDLLQYDLKSLTCEWFDIPYKQRAKFYPNLGKQGVDNFGLDQVARYLAKDLRYCWLIFQNWYPLLTKRGVKQVYDFEMELYPVIMDMEYQGFPVDPSAMGKVREELMNRQQSVQQDAWSIAGDQFSLSNPDVKRWVMFGEGEPVTGDAGYQLVTQGLSPRGRTEKTDRAQLTQEVLEFYAERGNHMAELLLEWSLMEKLRGTFIEGLTAHLRYPPIGLPTIHTSFKQHGTVTGRLSAAEPNLQQLPRGTLIRDLFVAPEGFTLIVADYDQVELRVAGYASQDSEMVRVFKEGQDIHKLAASAMMGIPIEQVTADQRQVGKTQNFGTLYGAGADKIAAVAGVSKRRAQKFIDNYFDMFPGLEDWKRKELRLARGRGDRADPLYQPPYVLIPPNGRRRRLPDLFHPDDWKKWRAERQAINAYVQGFASNIAKQAMIDLRPQLADTSASMIAQVHDELVVQVANSERDAVLALVERVMGGVQDPSGGPILGDVPLVASAAFGRSWAEAKAK